MQSLEEDYYEDEGEVQDLIIELYLDVNKTYPPQDMDLLEWFQTNYIFDGIDTWRHKNELTLN